MRLERTALRCRSSIFGTARDLDDGFALQDGVASDLSLAAQPGPLLFLVQLDDLDAIVEVVELNEERHRARLSCQCKVGTDVVLEGEAVVKVPRRPED